MVTIPGFTHPVKEVFLETALSMTGQLIGRGSPYALSRDAFLRRKKAFETTREFPAAIGNGDADDEGDAQAEGGAAESSGQEERLDHVQISLLNVDEGKINYDLIEGLLEHMHGDSTYDIDNKGTKGSVLVFLPGLAEIQRAYERVQDLSSKGSAGALWPVPVHGSLSPAGVCFLCVCVCVCVLAICMSLCIMSLQMVFMTPSFWTKSIHQMKQDAC